MKDVNTYLSSLDPKGIINIGATCYVATSLQCLGHCESFLKKFLSSKVDPTKPITSNLRDLYVKMWIKGEIVNPVELLRIVQQKFKDLMYILQQNDAMEFLTLFIDTLNSEMGEKREKTETPKHLKGMDRLIAFMDAQWNNSNMLAYSYLTDVIYGQNVLQMSCGKCCSIEHSSEVFVNMHISFDESDSADVKDMIIKAYVSEKIDDRECDTCKTRQSGTKSHKLWKAPQILIVNIKRFTHTNSKITKEISVPENLDLGELYIFDDDVKYSLKAIACHTGACQGGHYFAICKRPNGIWFLYDDDDSPKELRSYHSVSSSTFYIMFYELMKS